MSNIVYFPSLTCKLVILNQAEHNQHHSKSEKHRVYSKKTFVKHELQTFFSKASNPRHLLLLEKWTKDMVQVQTNFPFFDNFLPFADTSSMQVGLIYSLVFRTILY